jgi:hypothetical protein
MVSAQQHTNAFCDIDKIILYQQFEGHRNGQGGPHIWLPRSPDMMPLDYYLQKHMKSFVHETKSQTIAKLTGHSAYQKLWHHILHSKHFSFKESEN